MPSHGRREAFPPPVRALRGVASARSQDSNMAVTLSFSSLHIACSADRRVTCSSRWRRLNALRTSRTTRSTPRSRSSHRPAPRCPDVAASGRFHWAQPPEETGPQPQRSIPALEGCRPLLAESPQLALDNQSQPRERARIPGYGQRVGRIGSCTPCCKYRTNDSRVENKKLTTFKVHLQFRIGNARR